MRYTISFELPRVNSVVECDNDQDVESAAWDFVKDRTLGDLCQGQTVRAVVVRSAELAIAATPGVENETTDAGSDVDD